MHFIESSSQQLMSKISAWISQQYGMAERLLKERKCLEAGYEVGKALHTIQDSYSTSHIRRQSHSGRISAFFDYNRQDPLLHKMADKRTSGPFYDMAQDATFDVLQNLVCGKGGTIASLIAEIYAGGWTARLQ